MITATEHGVGYDHEGNERIKKWNILMRGPADDSQGAAVDYARELARLLTPTELAALVRGVEHTLKGALYLPATELTQALADAHDEANSFDVWECLEVVIKRLETTPEAPLVGEEPDDTSAGDAYDLRDLT